MSDTPRTDAMMTALLWRTGETLIADVEFADFARELERENATLRSLLREAVTDYEHLGGTCDGVESEDYIARVKAALGEAKP